MPYERCEINLTHTTRPRFSTDLPGNETTSYAEVEISSSGLSVWFDGSYLFERTPLPKWNPREEWGFSFGARAGYAMTADGGGFVVGPMTHNSIANVNVERGAAVESSTVAVHVSANGQQFVRAGVYGYHAHPHVLHLTPTVGFAAGGTGGRSWVFSSR